MVDGTIFTSDKDIRWQLPERFLIPVIAPKAAEHPFTGCWREEVPGGDTLKDCCNLTWACLAPAIGRLGILAAIGAGVNTRCGVTELCQNAVDARSAAGQRLQPQACGVVARREHQHD